MLTLFVSLISMAFANHVTCVEGSYTHTPPFHVSDGFGMKSKLYENIKDENLRNVAYIPKRSIVRVAEGDIDLIESRKNHYVTIEVISIPSEGNTDFLNNWWKIEKGKGVPRMQVGQIGLISNQSLIRPTGKNNRDGDLKEYDFYVKKDAPAFKLLDSNESVNLAGLRIKPVYVRGQGYEIRTCCDSNKVCSEEYLFSAYGGSKKDRFVRDFYLPEASCSNEDGILAHLRVLPKGSAASLRKMIKLIPEAYDVDDLKVHPSRPLVQIPVQGSRNSIGPFNSHHYRGNEPRRQGGDNYLHPNVACAFTKALRDWDQEVCRGSKDPLNPRGCQVQWGDASDIYFDGRSGSRWPHGSHTSDGNCIDIRPMKKDNAAQKLDSVTYRDSRRYDREKTLEFLKFLKKYGMRTAGFLDPKVYKSDRQFQRLSGHHAHIHVCFDEESEEVINACVFGVNPF